MDTPVARIRYKPAPAGDHVVLLHVVYAFHRGQLARTRGEGRWPGERPGALRRGQWATDPTHARTSRALQVD